MAYNKIVFGSETLIDLTEDTITPDDLRVGVTAHDASGAPITGTASAGGTGETANILHVTFDELLIGEEYVISNGDETITGMVPTDCVIDIIVTGSGEYTVECDDYTANVNVQNVYNVSIETITFASTFGDNTPAQIQAAVSQGVAKDLWSVGDTIAIKLDGTVGAYTFSNETYYAFILGFDHNKDLETEGKNSLTLGFGKMEDGTDIAFIDSNYNSTGSSAGFRMNTSNTNVGGWESSYMRNTICPAFYDALPNDWQNVISTITKYQDNKGSSSNTDAGIWNTDEQIFLLAEYEIFGSRTYANSYEQNYQQQYDYYAAGNSKIKYRHSATSSACTWWSRSARYYNSNHFCYVSASGTASYSNAYYSYGLAPALAILG